MPHMNISTMEWIKSGFYSHRNLFYRITEKYLHLEYLIYNGYLGEH